MRKIKFSAVFAAIGFILSFIAGFFSHSSIIFMFLKALLTAVAFGILGFGINIIFDRFLNESSDQDFNTDGPVQTVSQPQKGQLVDITIQDEELQESDSGNHFVVGTNRQMLNNADTSRAASAAPSASAVKPAVSAAPAPSAVPVSAPAAPVKNEPAASEKTEAHGSSEENKMAGSDLEAAASASGFVPVRNLETITSVSGTEALKSSEISSPEENSAPQNVDDELDVLPDMEGLSLAENDEDEGIDADTDSEFVSVHKKSGDESSADIKDAELMAKAISDVLSRDDS